MNWNYEHRTEKVRMQILSLNLRGLVKNTWIKELGNTGIPLLKYACFKCFIDVTYMYVFYIS